jgi:ribosome recycling factor
MMAEDMDLDELLLETEDRMDKSLSSFDSELGKIRTGRASTGLIEHIMVDYYGTMTPINQMATVSIPEARTILIQPWDQTAIREVEKAIQKSELGINPSNDGKTIRLNIPVLTEDRRKELVKFVSKLAEDYRVSVRQIRKDVNHKITKAEKEEHIPEDEVKSTLKEVQDLTDKFIKEINAMLEKKEKDIMEV